MISRSHTGVHSTFLDLPPAFQGPVAWWCLLTRNLYKKSLCSSTIWGYGSIIITRLLKPILKVIPQSLISLSASKVSRQKSECEIYQCLLIFPQATIKTNCLERKFRLLCVCEGAEVKKSRDLLQLERGREGSVKLSRLKTTPPQTGQEHVPQIHNVEVEIHVCQGGNRPGQMHKNAYLLT